MLKCRFLDKAAIVIVKDDLKSSQKPNLWMLNTVHRVEELKSVIRMLPIWAAGIIFFTASAQQQTFSLQQANTMDRHLTKSFQIPSASMNLFTVISMLTMIAFYDRVFVPFARKLTGLNQGITFLHRMGIGFFISIFATLVAGFIEVKRKHAAMAAPSALPISVFWLVPQYSLHGIAEAFMAIGHLEFFYDQAPESMRSTATALFWTANSAGYYASTLLVSLVTKFSAGPNGSNWLPGHNLNKGKLEYFYWLITSLQVLNFVYYFICAKCFTFKSLQIQTNEGDDDKKVNGLELENGV